ncbi:transcription factor bHLH94-like [Phragmites australis]|uniref:transcription factor bHLH94-like n=1 Tax=Phragmites australis TaxID=29695 RepID=UPI002D776F86|nr:transcription factor bHLH94-like [Phragmites australis]
MSTLVDALCAPSDSALIYDTFNAASFLFDNATTFCDAGIVGGPAPVQQQVAEAAPGVDAGAAVAAAPGEIEATSSVPRVRKRRRRARSCKSREETENQRMMHIAVERNRRRQMNEYLAVLRSLMPESYVQRGDQASIVGGAIEFVKELEQQLQSLEAQKRKLLVHQHKAKSDAMPMHTGSANAAATTACVESTTTSNCSSSVTEDALSDAPPFAQFFTYPQYVWCHSPRESTAATLPAENGGQSGVADIEVSLVETHASLRVMTPQRPGQLLRMIAGLQALRLTVLHLSVTTLDSLVLYSLSVKVEEGCGLMTVDDIAAAVHHVLCVIDAEATSQQTLAAGQEARRGGPTAEETSCMD